MPSELIAMFLRSDIHPCNELQLAFIPLSARHLSHGDRLARLQIPRTDVGFDGFQSFPAVLEGAAKRTRRVLVTCNKCIDLIHSGQHLGGPIRRKIPAQFTQFLSGSALA